jgi:phage terminase small subunit
MIGVIYTRSMSTLTPKQEQFCQEYLVDLNATQAAVRAGYSQQTAGAIATENLTKPLISARIAELQAERAAKIGVTQEAVIAELAKMAFANMADYMTVAPDGSAYMDLTRLTRDQAAAIQELNSETYLEKDGDEYKPVKKSRIKLSEKRGNLELLGKHLGMFKEEVNHTGKLVIEVQRLDAQAVHRDAGDADEGDEE